MISGSLRVGAVALGLASMPAAAGCLGGSHFHEYDRRATTGVIGVVAGTSCRLVHGVSPGPMYETYIFRPPQHGSAAVEGRHTVVYTPHRNYVGRDMFVFVRRGLDTRNNSVARAVGIRVFVVPARSFFTTGSRR